ncbi:hypothetical protein BGX30_014057, partial [Mortierella sp. GBA39]
VTGCIDSSVWGQNPTDEGGQMDSHGWPYSCQGWKKFVSLIEPASNTYCIRCCAEDNNVDCNTSISTHGCWNVVPGLYQMADGSVCAPPAGSNVTAVPTVVSPSLGSPTTVAGGATGPAVTTGAGAVPTGSSGTGSSGTGSSGSSSGSGSSTPKPSVNASNSTSGAARGLVASNVEVLGALAAVAIAFTVGL